ncbi:hypothetical protein HKD37_15G043746 [Glycine soja]
MHQDILQSQEDHEFLKQFNGCSYVCNVILILSLGVIMSQARAYPSSSLVSKMSQSFQSPSRPLYHKEGQKSTQEPVAAANLRMIPTSRPNPATAVIASNKLRRIPPSRSNPTQNM